MGESSSRSSPKSSIIVPGVVVLARGGSEEAELGGLADDQAEFAVGDAQIGAFFHAEGGHREGFQRGGKAGHGGHGGFDADVVGARHAAADAHAFALARRGRNRRRRARRRASGLRPERLDGRHAFLCEPAVQRFKDALAHELGMQHAAVEQDVRGAGQAAGAAPHAAMFGGGRLLAQEARQVAGDGGIGGVGQADLLPAGAALARWACRCSRPRAGSRRAEGVPGRRAAAWP